MTDAQEILKPLGQEGLKIETEQDPASTHMKALTNAPDGALKHGVNVHYGGCDNLSRRLGYTDLFYNPGDGTRVTHRSFNDPGTFVVDDKTYAGIITNQHGVRGLYLYVYMDYKYTRGSGQFDRKKYTMFALQDNPNNTYPESHTYMFARDLCGTAGDYVRQLEAPLLDRLIYPNTFSDVNIRGMQRARFWNYTTWHRGSQNDSYLLGTYGGHYTRPGGTPAASAAWLTQAALNPSAVIAPPPGSFDAPSISANCHQRRVLFTNPEWYHEHARIAGYVNIRLDLVEDLTVQPRTGNWITGSISGATLVVTSGDLGGDAIFGYRNSPQDFQDGDVLTEINVTGAPTMVTVPPGATVAANGVVYPCNEINVGYWQAPFIWYHRPYDAANTYILTMGGTYSVPPAIGATITGMASAATMTVASVDMRDMSISGVLTSPNNFNLPELVTDSSATMVPDPALLVGWRRADWDEFYAEPCGRFIESYNDSLFMARIERTYLFGSGYHVAGTPRWIYEPSAVMCSFWGRSTGMELGTPPVYPFNLYDEPSERVWGCQAYGFHLNRHWLFREHDKTAIVGLKQWNQSLYVMKPTGFGRFSGLYSGTFALEDLEMSQGPCGAKAWGKADEGIYYCTKRGLYLFDGNPASQNFAMSDMTVKKIFRDDIDWMSTTDNFTGEILGVSMMWDKNRSEVWVTYPKVDEQGGNTGLPAGCPTRGLIYDTQRGRFTEYDVPLPVLGKPTATHNPCFGLMACGELPTDEDFPVGSDPIGNDGYTPNNGRILWRLNHGHLDNGTLTTANEINTNVGERIKYDCTTKDYVLGTLKHKNAVTRHRSNVYANNGSIKQKVIYNYYASHDETNLVFPANTEDGYIQSFMMVHGTRETASVVDNTVSFSAICYKYYHDDRTHIALTVLDMVTAPAIGSTITGAGGATMIVTYIDLVNHLICGVQNPALNFVVGEDLTGSTLAPVTPAVPHSEVDAVGIDTVNTNIYDNSPQFISHSFDVEFVEGDAT